ncbi:MAG TPA: hypothetical protein VGK32_21635 [Vicinamibacterales bacterium]|jgi:hypothetical protein
MKRPILAASALPFVAVSLLGAQSSSRELAARFDYDTRAPLSEKQLDDRVQTILDVRRGADLLLARPDVDPARLDSNQRPPA